MKHPDIFMINAAADEIELDSHELAQRLQPARGYSDDMIVSCKHKLMQQLSYKCAYIRIPVGYPEENVLLFDFAQINSRNLYKNLHPCREAFVFAVTCGSAVDRYLARLKITSQAEYFITDALASTAADSFCGYVADKMKTDLSCCPRFSPGYGDLSLTVQQPLLERLDARDLLGITLGAGYLMSPMKSITAIMGIKNEENN